MSSPIAFGLALMLVIIVCASRAQFERRQELIGKKIHFGTTHVIPNSTEVGVTLFVKQPDKIDRSMNIVRVRGCDETVLDEGGGLSRSIGAASLLGSMFPSTSGQFQKHPDVWNKHLECVTKADIIHQYEGSNSANFTSYSFPTGWYILLISAFERTKLVVYMNTGVPIPELLSIDQDQGLTVHRHRHSGRLIVRWQPSIIDPQIMHYCLVISQKQTYDKMCAIDEYPKIATFDTNNRHSHPFMEVVSDQDQVKCLGPKTNVAIGPLQNKRKYFLSLFVRNKETRLTTFYASKEITFRHLSNHVKLPHGKLIIVNLRQHKGIVMLRFRIQNETVFPLEINILPCGEGTIFAEVQMNREIVEPRRIVNGYTRIVVNEGIKDNNLILRLSIPPHEERRCLKNVQVLALSRKDRTKVLLPLLPDNREVMEFKSLRVCKSVTIAWENSPEFMENTFYCVTVTELPSSFVTHQNFVDQCFLDKRLNRDQDYYYQHCIAGRINQMSLLTTYKVENLRPGQNYLIQVTAKQQDGLSLSYDYLYIHTKNIC